jgi:ubiquitin thioesterase OTU1
MRLRIRGPDGQSTVNLADDASVGELRKLITETTSITDFDVKFGYPPEPLAIADFDADSKLSDWGINLKGEQLLISDKAPPPPASSGASKAAPLSLTRKPPPPGDAPEIAMPSRAATMVLRIMPDDNSCLFRAFNSAYFGAMDNMHELRSVVAQTIQAQPEKYSAAVLDRPRDDYCRWIQSTDAWGGAIELDILSRHFDVEICSIDVQSLRIDRFHEGAAKRCVLVYSGIHYDVIALSPAELQLEGAGAQAPPEFDEKVFDAADGEVLEVATELCRVLQGQHYFTDTAGFALKCNTCGGLFTGEKGATEHAAETGHYDFGEAG